MPRALNLFSALAIATGTLFASVSVAAEDFPNRPVRIVVASVPGSAPDVLARFLAEAMAPALKQPVVVDNKPGAGGVIGVDSVAKAPADGYTLVVGHDGTMAMSAVVQPRLPYDPVKDFAAVAPLGYNEFVLVANASVPVRSFQEFVEYARSKAGKATYGSAGVATPNHVIMEQLGAALGFSAIHVPYKGGPAAVQDLVGGQVEFMIAGLSPALPHIRSGKLVALAVTQANRSAVLPQTPTVSETLPGFSVKSWFGLFAPAQTPAPVVARLNREVRAAIEQASMQQKVAQRGMVAESGSGESLAAQVVADITRYRVLATKIKLDAQ